ncbi:MAG: glycosyltransferase family 39 protein [Ardenticatenaceae bacterium]|nr:glycosyltransferase family 39 protein [Ardenticatenaceae bacterium]MCB9004339.1 glycosyltransferase family 39 protein [Ardenticatenaceae bacterium]
MPVEIIYLWLAVLPVFVSLLYVRHRLQQSHRSGEPFRLFAEESRAARWWSQVSTAVSDPAELPEPPAIAHPVVDPETVCWPVAVLLGSGVLLLLLGQAAYRHVPFPGRWRVFGLMAVGLAVFLFSGYLSRQELTPGWVVRPLTPLSHFLQTTPLQVLLLPLALLFAWMASLTAGSTLSAYHAGAATTAWLAAMLLVVLGSLRPGEQVFPRLSRGDWVMTAVLFLIAFLLRGLWLDKFPDTLSGDEGSAGLVARDFRNGLSNNPFAFGWFSFPSLYFAVQSIGIWLLGSTTAALRITSALAGALTVTAVYWLARSMFNRTTALVAAAYLAASHYHIHISRIGLNNVWDGLFAAAAIGALWHGWRTNRRSSFIFAGLLLALGQYFYVSIRVLPLLFTLWAGIAFWAERERFRHRFAGLLLSAYTALVTFLPLGLLYLRFPDNFNAPMQRVTIFNGWLDHEMLLRGQSAASIILEQMLRAALGFTHQPLRLLYDPGAPLLLTGAATLFILGVVWALLHLDLRYTLLLLPLISAVITSGFSLDPPASQRYILSMPLVVVLLAVPLGEVGDWLRRLWPQKMVHVAVVTAVTLILMFIDIHYYFFDVYDTYVLGGWNTETATEIAYYLRDEPAQTVYFFGAPRMGYYSLSTIPYLAPQMRGIDVVEPLVSAPSWPLDDPTLFIFLPERERELAQVLSAYSGGVVEKHEMADGRHVFTVYAVEAVEN